jgi:beta-lactamase regulating signal transducer with metallopeptidase domain
MNLQLSLASAIAQALLHSVWQLALIGLLASLGFNALRAAPAKTRHALGMAFLLAMALAPLATFVLCWQPPTGPEALSLPGLNLGQLGAASLLAEPLAPAWHDWLLVALSQIWLLGVVAMSLRQLGGWRWLSRIEAQPFAELPLAWRQRVDALAAGLGIGRQISVRLAQHVASPFTTHAWRPVIWLPLSLLSHMPADHIEALLAHELAHIRRLDWCWNALQCVIEGLLFHHPAMWWLSRRIRQEREHACDDLAVSVSGDSIALAEALVGLQQARQTPVAPLLALTAAGGTLMQRVEHLLARTPRPANWKTTALLMLAACSAALIAMQVAPPAHLLTNLTVSGSASGELTPGSTLEYTASYLGEKQRRYRVSMDSEGRLDESYSEGGEGRPIDARVRAWLASVAAMHAGTKPEAASTEPDLPGLPRLEDLPEPPPAPVSTMSEESARLMAAISADSRVTAVTGLPVSFDRQSFHGSIHTWGARDFHLWGIDDPVGGKASFTMSFVGPKGRVEVRYSGRTVRGGDWAAESLEVLPLPR